MTASDDDAGENSTAVTVSLRPSERSIPAGTETTFELVVTGASGGVSAYESAVHVDDPGRLVFLELTGEPTVPVADIVDEDTSAVMAAAMGPESEHEAAEQVVIAELTVTGSAPGETELVVDDNTEVAPISDGIERYTVGEYGRATLTVTGDDEDS